MTDVPATTRDAFGGFLTGFERVVADEHCALKDFANAKR